MCYRRVAAAEVNFMDLSISSSTQDSPDLPQAALPQLDSPTGNPVIQLFSCGSQGLNGSSNTDPTQPQKSHTPHTSFKASAEATLHSPAEDEPEGDRQGESGIFNFEVTPPAVAEISRAEPNRSEPNRADPNSQPDHEGRAYFFTPPTTL